MKVHSLLVVGVDMVAILAQELALDVVLALALANVVVVELLKHVGHLATRLTLGFPLEEGEIVVGLVHGVVHVLAIAFAFVRWSVSIRAISYSMISTAVETSRRGRI
jgi:hypothetical protein